MFDYEPTLMGTDTFGREWYSVGTDPDSVLYCGEDDAEAIDKINKRVFLEDLGECHEWYDITEDPTEEEDFAIGRRWDLSLDISGAIVRGGSMSHEFFVRKDSPAWKVYETVKEQIEDFCILDESAYFEADNEAWESFFDDSVKGWIVADVVANLVGDKSDVAADKVAEFLDNNVNGWISEAHEGMSYYYGFSGEYDHDGAVDAVTDWAKAAIRAILNIGKVLGHYDRLANGILPLPFPA